MSCVGASCIFLDNDEERGLFLRILDVSYVGGELVWSFFEKILCMRIFRRDKMISRVDFWEFVGLGEVETWLFVLSRVNI